MKKLIIATAIALTLPGIGLAEEVAHPVSQPPTVPGFNAAPPHQIAATKAVPPSSLAKILRITGSQQKALDAYEKAEADTWAWENGPFGKKNAYITAATNAIDGLYKSGLSQQQLDELLRGPIEDIDASQQGIELKAKELGLNDEQKALYTQYVKAGSYKTRMDAEVSQNLFNARKALNAKLSAQQLRIASDYGLIDARPAPRDEWSKFMGYVK
jgi:hypothetical protein